MVKNGIICTRIILFYSDPVFCSSLCTHFLIVCSAFASLLKAEVIMKELQHILQIDKRTWCVWSSWHTLQLLSIMAATVKIFKSLSGLINFLKYLICDMHGCGCTRVVTPWKIGDGHIWLWLRIIERSIYQVQWKKTAKMF